MTYTYVHHVWHLRPILPADKRALTRNTVSFDASFLKNSCEYPHKPYIARN